MIEMCHICSYHVSVSLLNWNWESKLVGRNAAIHVDFSGKDDASNRKRGFDKKITRFKKKHLAGVSSFLMLFADLTRT